MRLESVAAFSALVKQVKADHPKVSTNCYLMPNDIADFCLQNRMQYVLLDAGVYFLCDMGNFYRVYYYLDPEIGLGAIQPADKPMAIEFVAANGRIRPQDETIEENWAKAGFVLNTKSLRLQRITGALPYAVPEGFSIRIAKAEDGDAVYALWFATFDPVRNLLPSREALSASIEKGEVLCAFAADGQLAGVLQAEFGRGIGITWHIAVDEACRGKGLYWPMLHAYYALAKEKGIEKHHMWVEENNTRVLDTVTRHGYAYDGIQSRQYVLGSKDFL